MSDEEFITTIKNGVIGEKNHMKVIRMLKGLGFVEAKGGKRGHYFFTHKRLGHYKVCVGSSPSDGMWGFAFVKQIRHAMWKAAA